MKVIFCKYLKCFFYLRIKLNQHDRSLTDLHPPGRTTFRNLMAVSYVQILDEAISKTMVNSSIFCGRHKSANNKLFHRHSRRTQGKVLLSCNRRIKPGRRLLAPAIPAFVLILVLSILGSGCSGDPKPASARANVAPMVPVSVATAERRDVPYYLTGLGSVTAYYTVSVKSRVDGQLMQVNFKEGQYGKGGRPAGRD